MGFRNQQLKAASRVISAVGMQGGSILLVPEANVAQDMGLTLRAVGLQHT